MYRSITQSRLGETYFRFCMECRYLHIYKSKWTPYVNTLLAWKKCDICYARSK